jgi:aldose 1-epimerase
VVAPSGEQYEIRFADQHAVVVEVGGGLRAYSLQERDVLDGYDAGEMCGSGRGQVLVPWPNRIAGGRYEFQGRSFELAIDEPSTGSAIHGLVRWDAWTLVEREDHRVVVAHRLHPRPGYPFDLDLRIEYELSAQGLRVVTTATDVGAEPCPFGAGAHPYLEPGTAKVDDALLRLPVRRVLDFDEDGTSAGAAAIDDTEFDFRKARKVGNTALDHCFTDLERDDDGLARVVVGDDETGVTLWLDEAYPYVVLYTGDDRPDIDRRSIAVEPMTCPPQAFKTGEGLITLDPGRSFAGTWGLSPARVR